MSKNRTGREGEMKRKDIMLDPDEEKERVYEQINALSFRGKR
jgi:hypothetical protein